ncbi:hypothetical protein Lfu02_08280 [Longispora fulva]|uniref:Uncharacterized protein n=1 Tax=Longispora fulva TaxID=619741 RepID=A0A8J7GAQ7_9ACTN|nr:hypothetical protein [Longispora fulva]MBG6135305.1 hypothetical protein [Longispora fulva]GIG56456.1 hypothetical protein Lfu02_08280 [Longispora fulva]
MSTPDDRPGSRLRVAPWLPPEHAVTGDDATRELPVAAGQDTVELGLVRRPRRRYAMVVLCGVIVLLAGVGLWTATRTDPRHDPVLPTPAAPVAAPATTRQAPATTGAPTPGPSPSPTPSRIPRTSAPPTTAGPTVTVLGAPDVAGQCAATTGGQARLRRPAQGPDAAIDNWSCADSLGLFLYGTDLTAACQRQHGRDAYAEFTNRDDATSWRCRR